MHCAAPYDGYVRFITLSVCTALASLLLLSGPAAAAPVIDQQSTGSGTAISSSEATSQTGQTFTAGLTGLLTRIDVSDLVRATMTGTLTLNVFNTASGLPVGSTIASQAIPNSAVPSSAGQVSFVFNSPTSIIAGRTYAFALVPQSGVVNYGVVDPGNYVGGEAIQGGPSGWVTYGSPGPDLLFTTYVDTGDETVAASAAPAPVLQQFGKPASGTCDAAAPVTLNWSSVSSGGWSESWAQWVNNGNGGAVCTRTLSYSTTQSRWVVG